MHLSLDDITTVKRVTILVPHSPAVVGFRVALSILWRLRIVDIDSAELVSSVIAIAFESPGGCDRNQHSMSTFFASIIIHEDELLAILVLMGVLALLDRCQLGANKAERNTPWKLLTTNDLARVTRALQVNAP